MNKTLRMEKVDFLQQIVDRVSQEQVSYNVYGTTAEDSYLSGINEGIDRVLDALKEFEV